MIARELIHGWIALYYLIVLSHLHATGWLFVMCPYWSNICLHFCRVIGLLLRSLNAVVANRNMKRFLAALKLLDAYE